MLNIFSIDVELANAKLTVTEILFELLKFELTRVYCKNILAESSFFSTKN